MDSNFRYSKFKRQFIAAILALCVVSTAESNMSMPAVAATVKKEAAQESRILVDSKELFIDQTVVVNVMLKDRQSNEDLVIVPEEKGIVQLKTGKWGDDEKTFTLIPKKAGTVTLKISLVVTKAGKQETLEENEMNVHVSERKELTPREIYDNCSQAMIEIIAFDSVNSRSVGSGFFISENQILTNYHVIQEANKLSIRDYSGKVYDVTHIVDYTATYDLAILQVKQTSEHALNLNYKKVETGETVYALGSPLGLSGTLSEGIVSKAYRLYENMIYHQSTAYISKSSGGGPLLNCYGEVIGVNTLMLLGQQNVYFAVDIRYINQLKRKEPKPIKVLYDENVGKVKIENIYINIP